LTSIPGFYIGSARVDARDFTQPEAAQLFGVTEPRGSDPVIALLVETLQSTRGGQSHRAAISAGGLGDLTRFDNRRLLAAPVRLTVL